MSTSTAATEADKSSEAAAAGVDLTGGGAVAGGAAAAGVGVSGGGAVAGEACTCEGCGCYCTSTSEGVVGRYHLQQGLLQSLKRCQCVGTLPFLQNGGCFDEQVMLSDGRLNIIQFQKGLSKEAQLYHVSTEELSAERIKQINWQPIHCWNLPVEADSHVYLKEKPGPHWLIKVLSALTGLATLWWLPSL